MNSGVVLVVDGTPSNRGRLAAWLRYAGHQVAEVVTGAEALELLEDVRPDLIVVPAHLADMSGHDLCRRIADDPAVRTVPLLHFSATPVPSGPPPVDVCRFLEALDALMPGVLP